MLRGLAGVDWNVRDDDGWTPLTRAVRLGYAECLQIIRSGETPVMFCFKNDKVEMARCLGTWGLETVDSKGRYLEGSN